MKPNNKKTIIFAVGTFCFVYFIVFFIALNFICLLDELWLNKRNRNKNPLSISNFPVVKWKKKWKSEKKTSEIERHKQHRDFETQLRNVQSASCEQNNNENQREKEPCTMRH